MLRFCNILFNNWDIACISPHVYNYNTCMNVAKKSLKSLEFDKILEKLSQFARLKQSKDLCFQANIYSDIATIRKQVQLTKEAKSILDMVMELPLDFVVEVDSITGSTINSYLREDEILDVAKTMRSSRLVKNFLKENAPDGLLSEMALSLIHI